MTTTQLTIALLIARDWPRMAFMLLEQPQQPLLTIVAMSFQIAMSLIFTVQRVHQTAVGVLKSLEVIPIGQLRAIVSIKQLHARLTVRRER